MGLDMYLNRKVYLGLQYDHNKKENTKNEIVLNGKQYPTENLQYLEYNVGYWRKSNQIHKLTIN